MLRRFGLPALATAIVGTALVTATVSPADAVVTPTDAAAALDLPAGVTATVAGSAAVESQEFNDFPSKGSQYVVLSTGEADEVMLAAPLAVDDPSTVANEREPDPVAMSTDRGEDGVSDLSRLTLTVDDSVSAGCLIVDFAMATDETVRQHIPGTSSDYVSITRSADSETEYAMNAGRGYFAQTDWDAAPTKYTTNDIDYWHVPGDLEDVVNGQLQRPRLERWTRLNNVTTRDSARIPLDFSNGSDVINIDVSDGSNDAGELDSAVFVDNVRLIASCSVGTAASPSMPYGDGSIKGDRRVGYPLTYDPFPATPLPERYDAADNGWTHPAPAAPTDLRFRWYRTNNICPSGGYYSGDMRGWAAIPDADRQSYVPTNLDRGRCLIVLVSGVVDGRPTATYPNTDEALTNPQRWYVTLPIDYGVFQDGSPAQIAGIPTVSQSLSVSPKPTTPMQESWSYQWYADGLSITGATASSLLLTAPQRAKAITVRITASRSGFDSRSWTSAATAKVAGAQMESVGSPLITPQPGGQPPAVNDTMSADPGPGWPDNTNFTYQWLRDGSVIAGANGVSYAAVAKDAGTAISVVVTGAKPGYDPVSATSPAVVVAGLQMQGATPVIAGSAEVGAKLTGSADGWVPSASSLTYAWYAGGTLLQSGTSRTYTVTTASVGQSITLRVTGTKTGYSPLTLSSAPTAVVATPALKAGTVRIIGIPRVKSRLTASVISWGPAPVTISYQWKIGKKVVPGAKGAAPSLKLKKSARRKKVTLTVTITKPGYQTAQVVVKSKKVK